MRLLIRELAESAAAILPFMEPVYEFGSFPTASPTHRLVRRRGFIARDRGAETMYACVPPYETCPGNTQARVVVVL